MQDSTVQRLADIMKSLAHPIRLRILCRLVDGPQTVSQIHEHLATSYANVSQHLQRLQHQGLVSADKQANFVHYAITQPSIAMLIGTLRRLYCVETDPHQPPTSLTS